jgi:hypothetical protein
MLTSPSDCGSSCRYRFNFQQPLLVKYAGDNHRQRGMMATEKFLSYFPVGRLGNSPRQLEGRMLNSREIGS